MIRQQEVHNTIVDLTVDQKSRSIKSRTRKVNMSTVDQFESILKEFPTLKAPGVSGSRIKKLTDLAVKNVDQESTLISTLYSNCKAVPSSHKLGTLYVVDSIVRGYIEEAKKSSQPIDISAEDGTFGAGVYKISELVESLVDDALELLVNESQRVKISKLVDIWERAETFSPTLIARIRSKHFVLSTPPGTPPRSAGDKQETAPPTDSNSILSALASLAKNSSSAPAPQAKESNANTILSQLSALSAPLLPKAPVQENDQIFNMLQKMQNNAEPQHQQQQPQQQQQQPDGNRGRDSYENPYARRRSRSPARNNDYSRRERSPPRQQYGGYDRGQQNQPQSYDQGGQQGGQPGGYERPQQDQFQQFGQDPGFQGQQEQFDQGGFQNQFGFSQPPPELLGGEMNMQGTPHYRPRNVGFDQTLPQGSFKVLSRTLFIGGVPRNMDERALSAALRPYAEVQSVILNSERKHAFIKVYSRREAEQVITSFNKDNSMPLRTRWGVGFGPRDCCNYQHGVSIIPIQRLTDADKTWVVHAQWGGTGGQPLLSGMVIDEPDIEIGAGISSKAMSKKMPTNSARNGPKSNKPGEPDENYVKTTLIEQPGGVTSMSHGSRPDFNTFTQSSINPLSGLFAQSGGAPPQQHGDSAPAPPGSLPQFPGNAGGDAPNGAHLSAQLANLFQNNQR